MKSRLAEESTMDSRTFVAFRRSLVEAASRRGVLVGLTGGVLATGIVSLADDAEARRKGKRRNKRNNNKNKNNGKNKNNNKNKKAKIRLDATCPGAGEKGATHPAGEVRIAQTFTATRSGTLVKATIPVTSEADTETNFVLQVSPLDGEGAPTDEVLAEATVRIGRAPAAIDVLEFDFADPASVEVGVDYALVMSRPTGFEFVWRAELGNPCDGRVFVSADSEDPFEIFSEDADLLFETFVKS
jgi:hypothetical protein